MTVAAIDSFEHLATKKDLILLERKLLQAHGELKNDLIKWIVGLSFIQVGLYLSVVLFFHCN
jgi:hypothetical protein